jgi:hypothetical protein
MVHRITVGFVLLAAATLSAQAPELTVLPITRVVLYKSGIGYFEHLANVTGSQSLTVQFTGDQLDDVLKSLTAVDLGNGRVAGISYDSPTPAERRLRALRVPLAPDATTLQVLQALRGSRIEVRSANGAVVDGRVLHVERRVRPQSDGRVTERDELTLVSDAGEITTVEFGGSTRVRIIDADLRQDVARYLDIAATNSDRSQRRVVVSMVGEGTRQVMVSYVGEAAVWKTTYRLIFPSSGGEPTLQGWALVDNVSAADWTNVELSLVAGAPQAFRQPLSAPLFASRPVVALAAGTGLAPQLHAGALTGGTARLVGVVRDEAGGVLPGVIVIVTTGAMEIARAITNSEGRYEIQGLPPGAFQVRAELPGFRMTEQGLVALSDNGIAQRNLTMGVGTLEETVTVSAASPVRSVPRPNANVPTSRMGAAGGVTGGISASQPPPPSPAAVAEQLLLTQSITASAADLGDLFEYKLADAVTIRRNQSALVPILQTVVGVERLSLWNEQMGVRPRRAVWLRNTSPLTLDAGSLSIVEAGAFAGEGLVDTLKPDERRLVTYAADLGVQVNARANDSPMRIVRLRAAKGVVTQESEQRWQRTYTIRNDNRDARTVLIEHPVRADAKLAGDPTPVESTAGVHRFRVSVSPGQTVTLDVDEIKPGTTTFEVTQLHRDRLRVLVTSAESRDQVERAMAPIFAKSAELDQIEKAWEAALGEVQQINEDQDRLRENIKALGDSQAERRLLERYTRQLDDQENRVDALRKAQADYQARQARAERELSELIAAMTFDVTP